MLRFVICLNLNQSAERTWLEWPEIAGSKRFQANGSRPGWLLDQMDFLVTIMETYCASTVRTMDCTKRKTPFFCFFKPTHGA